MEQFKNRLRSILTAVPPGQRVVVLVALAVLAVTIVVFARWLTQPSYTLLYSNLDDEQLAQVIGELDAQGIPYRIEAGGSRVMVPRQDVYEVRAALAESGVAGQTAPEGYELLDAQSLAVSDFKQRVDYQRALEGEIAKTLMAMDGIENASVRLAVPEEQLFEEEQQPVTASVLVDPSTPLSQSQVETIVFLVSSAVGGLDPANVTVADSSGNVLSAPGEMSASSGISDRNLRLTREYEAALTQDVQRLLTGVTGGSNASVVVRADLDFDETQRESEVYDPERTVRLREETSRETLGSDGVTGAGGMVGVDGGPGVGTDGTVDYEKQDRSAEYGVTREITRTTEAPGDVERLSVAIVMDDGSLTGTEPPSEVEIEDLVTAALGLDEERGDMIQVSALPFPKPSADEKEQEGDGFMALIPTIAGVLVMVLAAVGLFLMARGRSRRREEELAALGIGPRAALEAPRDELAPSPEAAPAPSEAVAPPGVTHNENARQEVVDLVQRQPEEIAALLRNWLADRRR